MPDQIIDVIIPVYNAYDDLRQCVASVLRSTEANCRIILVDDCSPDTRIAAFFSELAETKDPHLLLLRNDANLGFVGTVNRAMSLGQHDVVLLNSDTVVTRGWLDKLHRCAASDPHIGTITPFSNNAEICSFPEICVNNEVPPDPELVNRALEAAAVPLYPDIPTAVGFCMYIRRSLLKRIGLFDAETFGLGYGEENDFCMRALEAGYRNVLCDDTYVLHVGSRSFDTKKAALAEENMRRLVAKHPDYLKRVTSFIADDPLRDIRTMGRSFLALQGEQGDRPGILHILHGRQGGTEGHVRDLIQAGRGQFRQYMLSTFDDRWLLEDANGSVKAVYQFNREPDELWSKFLSGICATFSIDLCHVHHLSGCRVGLLEAFSGLEVPYGFTIHDFFLVCPTINLLGRTGEYCGAQTDAPQCQKCLDGQPPFQGVPVSGWREAHQKFLQRARFVIAPTRWVAEVFGRYFTLPSTHVIPHGIDRHESDEATEMCSALLLPHDGRESIGVLGAIGPVKGARRLERLVARTRERRLPLRWVVIGYLDRQFQPYQDADRMLTVHGQYDSKNVVALLEHYRVRLTVFPSAGPETYCYTLSESWLAGRPALVPPIGALGERLNMTGAGWLMDDWQDEDRILDQVMALLRPENQSEFERRSNLARSVQIPGIRQMAEDTHEIYRNELVPGAVCRDGVDPLPNARVMQALMAEAGNRRVVPTPWGPHSLVDWLLLRLAHLGLHFRYTLLGRWLYRIVPVIWQQALKRRLLGQRQER